MKRKIQLIAGSTYSVSLPKDWIIKNKLNEKRELNIYERDDLSLLLSAAQIKDKEIKEITISVDEYKEITSVLLASYYLGAETINVISNDEIPKDVKKRIRKILSFMSGTEISYEDKKKVIIKILIDQKRINVRQLLYRISLIIDMSLENLSDTADLEEINLNEMEIDRLYHLAHKIISLSLMDSTILASSGIKNISLIPSYLLIAKKLENIGDLIYSLSETKEKLEKGIISFVRDELNRCVTYINGKQTDLFLKADFNGKYFKSSQLLRNLKDIEEELVCLSFYNNMINKKMI